MKERKIVKVKRVSQSRQGDVYLMDVPYAPDDAVPVEDQILAHGEATGHAHRVAKDPDVLVRALNGIMYAHTLNEKRGKLTHEEHRPHFFDRVKKVIRQQEFSPAGWRQVED